VNQTKVSEVGKKIRLHHSNPHSVALKVLAPQPCPAESVSTSIHLFLPSCCKQKNGVVANSVETKCPLRLKKMAVEGNYPCGGDYGS